MVASLFILWAGFVLGVSFLATPIKFRAESLTLPVALDVGRVTFHALGRVEWLFSLIAAVALWRAGATAAVWLLVVIVLVIVAMQALWLIPALDVRVAVVIAGDTPPRSYLHQVFIAVELAKVAALLAAAAVLAS